MGTVVAMSGEFLVGRRTSTIERKGAEYGDRTRDIQLGKLALYQLS